MGEAMELLVTGGVLLAIGLAIFLSCLWRRPRRADSDLVIDARKLVRVDAGWMAHRELIAEERLPGSIRFDSAREPNRFRLTAFAPDRASAGEVVLLQAYCHLDTQSDDVLKRAAQIDPDAKARGAAPLTALPSPHDLIRVTLAADGLHIEQAEYVLEWLQEPVVAQFELKVPEATSATGYVLTLRAEINGIPVGSMKLRLAVRSQSELAPAHLMMNADEGARDRTGPRPEAFRHYEHVFLSYASEDRERVLDVAQGLDRLGIGFFQDVLALRAGDNWQQRIEDELRSCDALLLFWSQAAVKSEWVKREAELALALQKQNDGTPTILPFILEQPPPTPPPSLAQIHFNDPISCVRLAATRSR